MGSNLSLFEDNEIQGDTGTVVIVPKTGLGKTFLDRGNSIFGCKTLLFAALIALSCLQAAVAQSQPKTPAQALLGNISGTVVDRSGAVVAGARLRLTRKDQSLGQEVSSGENGQFFFANIPPGSFQIIVTSAGFAAQPVSGVLVAGETYIVPSIVLAVATALTEVRVGLSPEEVAQEQVKDEEKQRVLGFVPNFYVSYSPHPAP